MSLDKFFSYKENEYEPGDEPDLFTDSDAQAASFANRGVRSPLTRGIDTLVIQIDAPSHPIGHAFPSVADKFPDLVEWYSASPTIVE